MSQSQISAFAMVMPIVMSLCAASAAQTPEWVSFPGEQWESITPARAGLDEAEFNAWVASRKPKFGVAYGGQQPESGGALITRGGYILNTWGDPNFKFQSASLGKTFTRMALELAIDEGLIENSAHLVRDYWTGERLLTPHKVMTRGHNAEVSFDHLPR